MIIHSNISPLPFYASLEQQHHRRKYTYGQVLPVISEVTRLLPFQFIIDTSEESFFNDDFNDDFYKGDDATPVAITKVLVHTLDDSASPIDITKAALPAGLKASNIGHGQILVLNPGNQLGPYLPKSLLYLSIELGSLGTVYSDVFAPCANVSDFMLLEYRSSHDLDMPRGYIDFSNEFTFRNYIDAELGKPEYAFEEEATARMGYTFIESQVSKKIYKFVFPGTEETCDALRIVRLCDSKRLTTNYKSYAPITFSMSANWEDQGDIASIECEFEVDNVIQTIGNLK